MTHARDLTVLVAYVVLCALFLALCKAGARGDALEEKDKELPE